MDQTLTGASTLVNHLQNINIPDFMQLFISQNLNELVTPKHMVEFTLGSKWVFLVSVTCIYSEVHRDTRYAPSTTAIYFLRKRS